MRLVIKILLKKKILKVKVVSNILKHLFAFIDKEKLTRLKGIRSPKEVNSGEGESGESSFDESSVYDSAESSPRSPKKFDINSIISQLPKIFSSSEIDEKVELKLKEKLKITVKDISNRFDEKVNKLRENLSKHI